MNTSPFTKSSVHSEPAPVHTGRVTKTRTTKTRVAAGIIAAATALAGICGIASTAGAADPVGSAAAFSPETGATLGSPGATGGSVLVNWQNSIVASRAAGPALGFSDFSVASGGAAASGVPSAAIVRAATATSTNLFWIEGVNTLKSTNAGGQPSPVYAPPAIAAAQQMVAIDADTVIVTDGAKVVALDGINAGSGAYVPTVVANVAATTHRITKGSDGNIWLVRSNPAAGQVDVVQRFSPTTFTQIGTDIILANAAANPNDIVASSDGSIWVSELGTNQVTRIDANLNPNAFPLPAGANVSQLVTGASGAVWAVETGLNGISQLSFNAGTFSRVAFPAPMSLANLQSAILGSDANLWVHSLGTNKLIKFGTANTTTTSSSSSSSSSSTSSSTTSSTSSTTTSTTTTTVLKCTKWVKKRVKVSKKKYVSQWVCTVYEAK